MYYKPILKHVFTLICVGYLAHHEVKIYYKQCLYTQPRHAYMYVYIHAFVTHGMYCVR